jgi:hypothetical protein
MIGLLTKAVEVLLVGLLILYILNKPTFLTQQPTLT